MVNVIVAGTKRQGEALIKMMQLDPDIWVAKRYGDKLSNIYYQAMIVRPSEGIEQPHYDYVLETLIPHIRGDGMLTTVPPTWRLPEPEEFEAATKS